MLRFSTFIALKKALVVAGVISCLDHDQEDQEWHVRAQTLDQTCFDGSFILVIANVCNVLTFFGVANNLHSLARVQFGVGAQRSGAPSCHRECGVGAQRSGAPRSPPNASPAQRGPRRDFSAFITYVPGGFLGPSLLPSDQPSQDKHLLTPQPFVISASISSYPHLLLAE